MEFKTCPKCGEENSATKKHCAFCGATLSDAIEVRPDLPREEIHMETALKEGELVLFKLSGRLNRIGLERAKPLILYFTTHRIILEEDIEMAGEDARISASRSGYWVLTLIGAWIIIQPMLCMVLLAGIVPNIYLANPELASAAGSTTGAMYDKLLALVARSIGFALIALNLVIFFRSRSGRKVGIREKWAIEKSAIQNASMKKGGMLAQGVFTLKMGYRGEEFSCWLPDNSYPQVLSYFQDFLPGKVETL